MIDDFRAIGQLIAFGLDPRLSPGRSGDYHELITHFRSDSDFRQRVIAVAAGQGLDILDGSPVYGLVLAAKGTDSIPVGDRAHRGGLHQRPDGADVPLVSGHVAALLQHRGCEHMRFRAEQLPQIGPHVQVCQDEP